MSDESQVISNADRLSLISAWHKAQINATAAVLHERTLREQVVNACFAIDKREGTEHFALPGGYDLEALKKLNYTLDKAKINATLDAIEELGPEGKFLADRLVKWQPDLAVGEFKKLDAANPVHAIIKSKIEDVLEIKPATPSLKLNPPKLAT